MFPASSEIPESVKIQNHLTQIHIDEWLRDDVFQSRWWVLAGLILLSVVIWYLLLDKTRAKEVCLFALLELLFVLAIVEYGDELVLWEYPTDIIPIFPPLTSFNLILLPLAFSLVFQYFKSKKGFVGAALLMSAIICFVIEPLLSWGNLYQLVNWQYYYSYPIYVTLALLVRFIAVKIDKITEKGRQLV